MHACVQKRTRGLEKLMLEKTFIFCCVLKPDLIVAVILLLHRTPRLPVITVCNFKNRHKLHHSKVFGPLSDDTTDALRLLQINLGIEQGETSILLKTTIISQWWVQPHLDPLGAVVVHGRPSIGLPVLVQAGKVRVPREAVNAPGTERTGGWNVPVWDEPGLHSQWLWATCRVWINCECWADGGRERQSRRKRKSGGKWIHPQKRKKDPHPSSSEGSGQTASLTRPFYKQDI